MSREHWDRVAPVFCVSPYIYIITINIEPFLGCHISHSLPGTVSTSPNLAKEGQSLLSLRARVLAKFGEAKWIQSQ